MNVRVNLNYTIYDGAEIVFKAPCDASEVTGLIVYYPNGTEVVSSVFAFADAHTNDLGDIDNLFVAGAVVKVILDTETNMAFVQNAATNAYLEGRFAGIGGGGSAEGAVLYTEQDLTQDEQERARANIGASSAYVVDYGDNLFPMASVSKSYEANGVTVTHNNGQLTVKGECTKGTTIELIPDKVEYAVLHPGKTYKAAVNKVSGTFSGAATNLIMYVRIGSDLKYPSVNAVPGALVYDERKSVTRFALTLTAGGIYDITIAPYLGESYSPDYAGGVQKEAVPMMLEAVEKMGEDFERLNVPPIDFADENIMVMQKVQEAEADFRLAVFTDPHSFEWEKYKKYSDLLNGGFVDCLVGLGDYQTYAEAPKDDVIHYITRMLSHSGRAQNCFYAVGNHDMAYVKPNSGAVDPANVLTKKQMFDCLCRHLNGVANYNEADPYGCYYYVDYTASKIRMIVLNTSDIYEADGSLAYKYTESVMLQQPQIDWLVNTALDLDDKANRSEWSVLVCSHTALPWKEMIADILSAFKAGTSLDKSWTITRRLNTAGTAVDTSNTVTITANKDFSGQGAVDVIGVLYGHDHIDTASAQNGIQFVGFICDNGYLDNYYVKSVSGLTAGNYCFTAANGSVFAFTLGADIADAAIIGYNEYLTSTAGTNIRIQDADGNTISMFRATKTTSVTGYTSISGFVQERTPGTALTESGSVVSINKDSRTINIVPYGTGVNRVISY